MDLELFLHNPLQHQETNEKPLQSSKSITHKGVFHIEYLYFWKSLPPQKKWGLIFSNNLTLILQIRNYFQVLYPPIHIRRTNPPIGCGASNTFWFLDNQKSLYCFGSFTYVFRICWQVSSYYFSSHQILSVYTLHTQTIFQSFLLKSSLYLFLLI